MTNKGKPIRILFDFLYYCAYEVGFITAWLSELVNLSDGSPEIFLFYPAPMEMDGVHNLHAYRPKKYLPYFSASTDWWELLANMGRTVEKTLHQHTHIRSYAAEESVWGGSRVFQNADLNRSVLLQRAYPLDVFVLELVTKAVNAEAPFEMTEAPTKKICTRFVDIRPQHIGQIKVPAAKIVFEALQLVRKSTLAKFRAANQNNDGAVAVQQDIQRYKNNLLKHFSPNDNFRKLADSHFDESQLTAFADPDSLYAATLIAVNAMMLFTVAKNKLDHSHDRLVGLAKEILIIEKYHRSSRWNEFLKKLVMESLDWVRTIEPGLGRISTGGSDSGGEQRERTSEPSENASSGPRSDWERLRIYLSFEEYQGLSARGLGKDDPVVTVILLRSDGKYVLISDSEVIGYSAIRIVTDDLAGSLEQIKRLGRQGAKSNPGRIAGRFIHNGDFQPRLAAWVREVLSLEAALG